MDQIVEGQDDYLGEPLRAIEAAPKDRAIFLFYDGLIGFVRAEWTGAGWVMVDEPKDRLPDNPTGWIDADPYWDMPF